MNFFLIVEFYKSFNWLSNHVGMVLESFSRFPSVHDKELSVILSPRNLTLKIIICGCFFRKLLSAMECQAMK